MLVFALAAIGLGSPGFSAPGAADIYLKIKDLPGDADDGSIALSGLAWDTRAEVGRFAEYTGPRDAGSGMASGRRQHRPMTIVKEWDKASPKLLEACAKGTHLGDVEVWSREAGRVTLLYTLQNVVISSYAISGPTESSPRPVESVSFAFEQIKVGPAPAVTGASSPRSN
jgi:type VI secretion system secreted protein Hcp